MTSRLFLLALPLLFTACGTPTTPGDSPAAPGLLSHEVVIDQGTGFLFSGNANMTGLFPDTGTTTIRMRVSSDGEPAENAAAKRLLAAYPASLPATATFFAEADNKGMIQMAGGRFEAIGNLNAARTEFRGKWFFDDLEGGTCHIAPRGTIFP